MPGIPCNPTNPYIKSRSKWGLTCFPGFHLQSEPSNRTVIIRNGLHTGTNFIPASERLPGWGSITGPGVQRIPGTQSSLSLRGTRGPKRTNRRLPTSELAAADHLSSDCLLCRSVRDSANQDVVSTRNDDVGDLDGFLERLAGLFEIIACRQHLALLQMFRSRHGITRHDHGCTRL